MPPLKVFIQYLRVQCCQVRPFISVMPFNALFVFPALYGIGQRSTFIVVEKIPYISIIFKLLIYVLFSGFLCALYFFICSYRICICLSAVGFKPFLKSNIERKAIAYLALKERPVQFRTNKTRFNDTVSCYCRYLWLLSPYRLYSFDLSCIKIICNPLSLT